MKQTILCLDLGGSKLAYALMSPGGELWDKGYRPWRPRSAQDILDGILPVAEGLLRTPGGAGASAIGLTIPGPCDHERGLWLAANFADIADWAIADEVGERLGLPAFADNDAKACTLAELYYGAGRGVDDFLYLTVSNGVGGGIVSGGRLLRGANNSAGEIGHCCVEPEGRPCACGKRGCLEAYAAGPGLSRTFSELSGAELSGKELLALALEGDEAARRAWEMEGDYLGRGIACAVNLLNPSRVIIGGGLSLAFEQYAAALHASLERHTFPHMRPLPRVMPTPLDYDGGLYGAAAVAVSGLRKKQEEGK